MKTVWIDVETTGIDHNTNFIIELAALYEDETKKDVFHVYILPASRPDDFDTIEELTGITWEYLKQNGITEAEAYSQFTEWLSLYINKYNKEDKALFAAYNARFDNDFIRNLFHHNSDDYFGSWFYQIPLDIMGTVMLCIRLGLIPILENFKNSTVCQHFGIEHKIHSAIEDIKSSRKSQLKMENLLS